MSHNVRSLLRPKVKGKLFQNPQLAKKSHSHFYFALRFFAKVEEQRTVEKRMRGSTRVDEQSVLLHLAFLACECRPTTIAKEN